MTFFKSFVLADPMEIIPSYNDGLLHFGGNNDAAKQAAADRDITSEGALLVNVGALDGIAWGLDAQTNVPKPSSVLASNAANERNGSLLRETLLVNDFRHGEVVLSRQ